MQGTNLFAAQCLVEVLLELYREGRSFEEVQLSIKLAAQGGTRRGVQAASAEAGAVDDGGARSSASAEAIARLPLLQGQDEDVLVSWVALVFLTLEELGVPRAGAGQPPPQQPGPGLAGGGMAAGSAYLRGMLGYVRQTLGMYDEGQTLAIVAGLQGLVQQTTAAATSPFLLLMQQYTRLVLLTVEVTAAAGLPTVRPLRPPETVLRPSGYSDAFALPCFSGGGDGVGGVQVAEGPEAEATRGSEEVCSPRGLAVRLLMAFMGAVLGSRWSLDKFVEGVRVAYQQGLAADELFSELDEQEFLQSGGLLPIASPSASASAAGFAGADDPAAPAASGPDVDSSPLAAAAAPSPPESPPADAPAPQHVITKKLLSSWISLAYMALAQLAVPYPAAGQKLGWAWAGFGDPTEALGMNDFVGNVLRQMAGADPRAIPQPEEPPQAGASGPPGPAEDAEGGSEGSGPAGRRRGTGALMVRVEDDSLPNTSTAFRVLSQQVALVQAICRDVMRF
ncbi:hypothetical protein GPECTOR_5g341 [Gonium pectorale]|uniref:Uncharacterized protein n=1 Tax=Gonium pectorale TaxID=33097 RepID=A0A150GWM0_GONPE|nr:hypothetical protein GPECTOR_5g341 [Gonium pectorale]|eukprot:KXZ54251.1 hypothetical protein GPECTOR_5g341 [Gonium pectorale]